MECTPERTLRVTIDLGRTYTGPKKVSIHHYLCHAPKLTSLQHQSPYIRDVAGCVPNLLHTIGTQTATVTFS